MKAKFETNERTSFLGVAGIGIASVMFVALSVTGVGVGRLRAAEKTPPTQPQSLRITATPFCPGEISPFQCGQFIEYCGDLIPGMWADKLYDNFFCGYPPNGIRDGKVPTGYMFKQNPWYPSGQTNQAVYSRDGFIVYGGTSQKIKTTGDAPCSAGLSQDGLAVDKSDPCNFSCYMKMQGGTDPVTVQIHEGDKVLATTEFKPTGEWQKFKARLVFSATSENATISISCNGPGVTLWLGMATLMPESAIGGWRRDVVEATREMKPGIIRYGGFGAATPLRDIIGDPDRRKRRTDTWGMLQPVGAGLEEIVQFIQAAGAETLMCVNLNNATQTMANAAAQVEYFNGATNTPMGALRAANGHPKPYNIKYWQIGNGGGPAEIMLGYCVAMKRVDPSISLMGFGPAESVKLTHAYIDSIGAWFYHKHPLPVQYFSSYRKMIQDYGEGKPIKVAPFEWNYTDGGDAAFRWTMQALEGGLLCARTHNFLHRNCDLVEIANRSNFCNATYAGFIQTDRARLYKTPVYYVQQLYAAHASNGKPLVVEGATGKTGKDTELDLSAVLSAGQDKVTLFVANLTRDSIKKELDFSAFGKTGQTMNIWVVADRDHAGDPAVANSFTDLARICTRPGTYAAPSPQFEYEFPPLSFTVLEWAVQK